MELCRRRLEEYKILVHSYGTTVLIFAILNLAFAVVAIFANILAIGALWRASSVPSTLKKLYLSLAASDLGVGVLAQPMYGIVILELLKKESNERDSSDFLCPIILAVNYFCIYLLTSASFLTMIAIAVDRLLAIFLHLRYRELVTPGRAVTFLITLWSTSFAVAFPVNIFIPRQNHLVVAIFQFGGLFVTTVVYIYTCRVVRYHRIKILDQCYFRNRQAMEALREKKSMINSLFIQIVFVACYLPNLCSIIFLTVSRYRSTSLAAYHVSSFLVLLNSSINPFVYCWRYRELREIVKCMMKKLIKLPTQPSNEWSVDSHWGYNVCIW